MKHKARAVLATETKSTGRILHEQANKSSATALGRNSGKIAIGYLADIAELPVGNPDLEGLKNDMALDAWIFSPDSTSVENLWSAGRHIVKNRSHINKEIITKNYLKVIKKLRSDL